MVQYVLGVTALACIAAAAPAEVTRAELAQSRAGRPIHVYTLADPGARSPDERPALLVVAGVSPQHRVGISTARDLIARDWGGTLTTHTLYVVPELNPDGAAWLSARPRVEWGRTVAPFDADRDRRLGEDPPNDLDGDGLITQMRIEHPPARYNLEPTLVADADDARLMRPADPVKGERARWVILTEGVDDDGDGKFNEDGPGGPGSGVDLDRNFPTHWPEFDEGAGTRALSEVESLALVRWMQAHRNIVAVLVLGPGDSLINKPPTGQYDQTGQIPKGLERDDVPYHDHVAEKYRQLVSMESAASPGYDGSLLEWAYADFGAWAFQSAVWSRPKLEQEADAPSAEPAPVESEPSPPAPTPADRRQALLDQGVPDFIATFLTATLEERQAMAAEFENASQEERAAMMAQVQALPPEIQSQVMAAVQETASGKPSGQPDQPASNAKAEPPARGKNNSDDGKWLAYFDAVRPGEGFVEWAPIEHPQLGMVEVGGFIPGARLNPPEDQSQAASDAAAAFVKALLDMLPSVEVSQIAVEAVGDRVWRVSVELSNPGYLPTCTAVGLKIGQPIAVEIELPPEAILSGRRVSTIDRLTTGPRRIEWLVRADTDAAVRVTVRSDRFGEQTTSTRLTGGEP
ncbi:MAG: hypothetical protein DYG94_07215 [Leptolyngbya sp. PLA3]|nr:MAG: hypothetical protein EDM82_06770 [Cyanobacteria bacterium CYA]MCE7968518.1 hypothetical protein [Leptolyngbya sp. PL-A3]